MSKPPKQSWTQVSCHLAVCRFFLIVLFPSLVVQASAYGDAEVEPNDATKAAQSVGGGSFQISSALIGNGEHGDRDVDIYRLTLSGPARIEAAVRAADKGSTLDAVLWLRTCATGASADFPDYCALGIRDDGPDGSLDPTVSVGVPRPTDVYLMVSGAGNQRYDPATAGSGVVGSVGPYDLEVTVTAFDGSGIDEPNDSILTAAPNLEFSNLGSALSVSGYVGDGPYAFIHGDRDFYSIRADTSYGPNGLLSVEVTPTEGSKLDPVVCAYDFLGKRLVLSDKKLGASKIQIVLPLRCGFPTPIYLMVMGTRQPFPNDPFLPLPPPGSYPYGAEQPLEAFEAFDAPGSVGAYVLSLHVDPGLCASEPDDTLTLATDTGIVNSGQYACTRGSLVNGSCSDLSADVDMWRVQVEETPAILEVVSSACEFESGHVLRVFDPEGVEFATASDFDPAKSFLVGNWRGLAELRMTIDTPGTYFIGLSHHPNDSYDPATACSGNPPGVTEEFYDILISLTARTRTGTGQSAEPTRQTATKRTAAAQPGIYATRLDDLEDTIEVLDSSTGQVTASLPTPEPHSAVAGGPAFDGTDLFYVGAGRYPKLYRMDPVTGAIIDHWHLWMGSGYYSGATMLAGQLYLLDVHEQSLHAIDPLSRIHLRTVGIGAGNDITMGGGLAALAAPHRLYVADAFGTAKIYEFNPSGDLTAVLDGFENRPTALGADGNTNRMYVGDWRSPSVEVIDRTGVVLGSFTLSDPVGALSGQAHAGLLPDCNGNGAADGEEIGNGSAADCNANGVPDDCDLADVNSLDCNDNDVPDECDPDCNENGIADDCETDCNDNGIPDSCEADCNGNGVADTCDIMAGTSVDTNASTRPDECEVLLFVDQRAPPDGDGSSWAQALDDLQSASAILAARGAAYGEIRVAQGVYKPAAPGGDRAATFRLSGGDQWMGGYAGIVAADPDLRDAGLFPTILSGDLNGDDGPNPENKAENSFHVVMVSGTTEEAVLDGFVITGGLANGDAWSDREGAGIFNHGGSPMIRTCTVVGNHNHANLLLVRGGGGMSNRGGRPTLVDCTFRENGPLNRSRIAIAGAMYNVDSHVTLLHCTFEGNSSGRGGALFNESSEVTMSQCMFRRNEAHSGGAMINIDSHAMLADCLFVGNKSGNSGSGASILHLGGVAVVQGCTFFGNTGAGRAIATPEIALLPPHVPGRVEVVNSILWNGGDEILNTDGSMIAVSYSDLTGGWGGPGGNNLDVDPLFVDPLGSDGVAGTSDDNLRFLPLSPCINAGDPNYDSGPGDTDLDGHPRVLCGRIDMGAYEFGIGDYTCDRAVDLDDHADWHNCATGPGTVVSDSTCQGLDFDADGSIDLHDFMGFQNAFGSP